MPADLDQASARARPRAGSAWGLGLVALFSAAAAGLSTRGFVWVPPHPELFVAGTLVALAGFVAARKGRAYAAVLGALARGADVGLRSLEGHARFGPRGPDGCRWEVEPGQVSWWRLKPGRHALCLDDIPNRRPWLPYRFEGVLVVRGHAVGLNLRERDVGSARFAP